MDPHGIFCTHCTAKKQELDRWIKRFHGIYCCTVCEESGLMFFLEQEAKHSSVSQSVESLTVNQVVGGSIPSRGANAPD